MKRFLLSLALASGLAVSAAAQPVNVVPQVGQISAIVQQNTYASTTIALAPASSATDVACISGSIGKQVRLTRIAVSGTAGTLVTVPITLLLRHSLDTGGTAASTTANWANNLGPLNPAGAAASATLITYSANPTINDSSPAYIRSGVITFPTTSSGIAPPPLAWTFGDSVDEFDQEPMIQKASIVVQQYCLNFNSISISSGVLNIDVEWTEQ